MNSFYRFLTEAPLPPPNPSSGTTPPPDATGMPPSGGLGGGLGGLGSSMPPLSSGGGGLGSGLGGMGGPPMGGGSGENQQPIPIKTVDSKDIWKILRHTIDKMPTKKPVNKEIPKPKKSSLIG